MTNELILKEIFRQNKHWVNHGEFFADIKNITVKRDLFDEIKPFLEKRQILSIVGLRRVGKTVLLKQIIQARLQKVDPESIFFLSFDQALLFGKIDLSDYLNAYLSKIAPPKKRLWLFLDEIQYAENWQHIIKRYYDTEPRIKFIISGSSSLFLQKKSTESLAGRIYDFTLPVLSFKEYLELKGADLLLLEGLNACSLIPGDEVTQKEAREKFVNKYKGILGSQFEDYLKFGQFPEIVKEIDTNIKQKYLAESVYRKSVEYDIPQIFGVDKIDELKFLFQVLINEVGSIVEIQNIARETQVNQATVKKYLEYFENSFLIHILYNFTKSFRKTKRGLKKVYLGSTNFFSAFHDYRDFVISRQQIGFLAENYCLSILKRVFDYTSFYRVRQKEIDFVATNDLLNKKQFRYFEVKYRSQLRNKDFSYAQKITQENRARLQVISQDQFRINKNYSIIPIWLLK
ncbi:ATP-binding protein [Patescibacteria group bacterium]|nr:ATP-binding protein [Patescibacteria group bacterium]